MFCETVAAGLLGMAGPMMATWLVALFGGVNVGEIKPQFFMSNFRFVRLLFPTLDRAGWADSGRDPQPGQKPTLEKNPAAQNKKEQ